MHLRRTLLTLTVVTTAIITSSLLVSPLDALAAEVGFDETDFDKEAYNLVTEQAWNGDSISTAEADSSGDNEAFVSSDGVMSGAASTAPTAVPYEGTRVSTGLHCGGRVFASARILQRYSRLAFCHAGRYVFELPATTKPGKENRRSEAFWSSSRKGRRYTEGQVMVFDGAFRANLGKAAFSKSDFHFVWQSHGPKADGTDFNGPLMHLNISQGRLTLGGGRGYPGPQASTARWYKDLGRFENMKAYRFRVEVKLSARSRVGYVSAWLNGKQVLKQYHPPRGTYYPGTAWVSNRGGLYRGTVGKKQPTYVQRVVWSPVVVS